MTKCNDVDSVIINSPPKLPFFLKVENQPTKSRPTANPTQTPIKRWHSWALAGITKHKKIPSTTNVKPFEEYAKTWVCYKILLIELESGMCVNILSSFTINTYISFTYEIFLLQHFSYFSCVPLWTILLKKHRWQSPLGGRMTKCNDVASGIINSPPKLPFCLEP